MMFGFSTFARDTFASSGRKIFVGVELWHEICRTNSVWRNKPRIIKLSKGCDNAN